MLKTTLALAVVLVAAAPAAAQNLPAPRPFPGAPPPPTSNEPATPPAGDAPPVAAEPAIVEETTPAPPIATTDPATGLPLYPGSVLLTEYAAGPNQQVYLYGSTSTFSNVVEYYKGVLKDRGRELFDGPMHQFDLGRFRRESMTLQPSVTVKDFTWNGQEGYAQATGTEVTKYPTVIQIVPAPPQR